MALFPAKCTECGGFVDVRQGTVLRLGLSPLSSLRIFWVK